MVCAEDIQDPISEQLKHYASPKGAHKKWREQYQKTVPLLVGDMEAWTHGKYSPTWYSLVAKNRRIKRDVRDS